MRMLMLTVAGLMFAAAAATGPSAAAGPSQLIVAMRDPGCHWFYLAGGPNHRKYAKTVVRHGPIALVNLDEAALVIKGPAARRSRRWARAWCSMRRVSTRSRWS